MAKKKKKKKPQKGVQHQLQNLKIEQLILKGKHALEAGKARDAIAIFKHAVKTHGKSEEINTYIFRAYLIREDQLRKKKLIPEANAIKEQAKEYMPGFDKLTESDLLGYISTCSNKDAFNAYSKYTETHSNSPVAEQFLASRLFMHNCWEFLEKFDETNHLRRDILPVQKAIPLMNDGQWEQALDTLRSISKSSPYSHIRMFCRALVSFYAEDDKGTHRALSMIPDNFPLSNVVKSLKNIVSNPGGHQERAKSMLRLQCLWDSPVNVENDMADFLYDLEHKRFRQAKDFICKLADAVYPQDTTAAKKFILQSLWDMNLHRKIEDYEYERLITDLLPRELADILLTKIEILRFNRPFTNAGRYISLMENEFPDPVTRKIAHAFILQDTVWKAHKSRNDFNIRIDKKGIKQFKKLLGIKSDTLELIQLEMTGESIRLDPLNRAGYGLIVQLPRPSRPARQIVETALISMAKHFPEDPFPCLELASVYYENNAFRKAENILEEAMKKAPHDNRVIDRHALAMLISVEKNLKREKFHIVERDLDKAVKLGSKKLVPFIAGKKIIFQIVKDQKEEPVQNEPAQRSLFNGRKESAAAAIIGKELDNLSLFEQLRVLSVLMLDIKGRGIDRKKDILKDLEKAADKRVQNIKELSSSEVMKLLMPLEKEYAQILPSLKIAQVFLNKWKDILKAVDDTEITTLYDLILEPDYYILIRKDIKRRIKKASKNNRLILEFHLAFIDDLTGKGDGADPFEDVIDQAGGALTEELRTTSRRLSKHASGPLKKALEMFDFEILDDVYFYDDFCDDDIDDIFPLPGQGVGEGFDRFIDILDLLDDDFEDLDLDDELVDEFVGSFESFVDDTGLRGAPDVVIRELRGMILTNRGARRDFDMLAKLVEKTGAKKRLTREAQLILFGKKK